jgi:hypothetical protein
MGPLKTLNLQTKEARLVSAPGEQVKAFTFRPSDGSLFYSVDHHLLNEDCNVSCRHLVRVRRDLSASISTQDQAKALQLGKAWWENCGKAIQDKFDEANRFFKIKPKIGASDEALVALGLNLQPAQDIESDVAPAKGAQ